MVVRDQFVASSVDEGDFEPFVVYGDAAGEVHWLVEPEPNGRFHAGVYRVTESDAADGVPIEYEHPCDEILYVLEGNVEITFADGSITNLKAGDVASFSKGTRTVWRFTAPFRKFFVEVSAEH
jgi:uncharacterized cupin superfamily protein